MRSTRITIALALMFFSNDAAAQSADEADSIPAIAINVDVMAPIPPAPRVLVPMYAGFATLAAGDGFLTWRVLRQGGVERNPVVATLADNPYGLAALKITSATATIIAMERLRRRHPRAAVWTMVILNGGMSWVVWHNARELRAIR